MILDEKKAFENIDLFKDSIFIYPTDSIYGIGCNALDESLIKKLRLIKNRDEKPFSIIAPSISWIRENFEINDLELSIVNQFGDWIKVEGKFRPFTLLLTLKNKNLFPKNLVFGLEKIGVRIPKNWFSTIVSSLNFPIVTTSVNVTGNPHMVSLNDADKDIFSKVDLIIDDGVLAGSPSVLITVENNEIKYLRK